MKRATMALASASILMLATPAFAGDGIYVGGGAGWSHHDGMDYNLFGLTGHDQFDDNARFDLDAGYKFPEGLRFELEGSYARYQFSHNRIASISFPGVHGDLSNWSLLGDVNYDIPIWDRLALTLGGGAGWAWVDTSERDRFSPPDRDRGTDGAFTWQLLAGLSWTLTDQIDVGVEYKFQEIEATNHHTYSGSTFLDQTRYQENRSDSVMLKIRFYPETFFQQP